MIIDTNAYLGNWPFRRLRYNTPDTLLERLGRAGIGWAWVASLDAVMLIDAHAANEPLAEAVADRPELLPLATLNPTLPGWERDLARLVEDFGFRGIRLYPNYHGYPLDDGQLAAVLGAAADLGVFVSVAVRMSDERQHHPLCMVPAVDIGPLPTLAAAHPQAPIIVVNAGRGDIAPLLSAVRETPNLHFEMSHFESVEGVETLGRELGIERVLFGTHAPWYYPESAVLKVMRECDFTDEGREAILRGNALRLVERG